MSRRSEWQVVVMCGHGRNRSLVRGDGGVRRTWSQRERASIERASMERTSSICFTPPWSAFDAGLVFRPQQFVGVSSRPPISFDGCSDNECALGGRSSVEALRARTVMGAYLCADLCGLSSKLGRRRGGGDFSGRAPSQIKVFLACLACNILIG